MTLQEIISASSIGDRNQADKRLATAYHEAGHAVVANALDDGVCFCVMMTPDGRAGSARHLRFFEPSDEIKVCLAGGRAERIAGLRDMTAGRYGMWEAEHEIKSLGEGGTGRMELIESLFKGDEEHQAAAAFLLRVESDDSCKAARAAWSLSATPDPNVKAAKTILRAAAAAAEAILHERWQSVEKLVLKLLDRGWVDPRA